MKKKLTIAAILFLAVNGLMAQTTPKFRFGIGGNTGYAWLKPTSKGMTSGDGQAGFGYGLMFDYNLSDNYAISTGLDINYRGGSLVFDGNLISSDTSHKILAGATKINLQYLEIPLQLKMKTKAIGYFTYFAAFGGSLGFALSRTGSYALYQGKPVTPSINNISIADDKLDKYTNPVAVSLIINIGTEYNISGKTSLVGSLFFNNSFVDILSNPVITSPSPSNPSSTTTATYTTSSRANVLGIKLGIFF
jgi:hypothetical protein